MSPITTLALADVGHRVTIRDAGNIVSGTLTSLAAQRSAAVTHVGDTREVRPGEWDRITLSISGVEMDVSTKAKWKMGPP